MLSKLSTPLADVMDSDSIEAIIGYTKVCQSKNSQGPEQLVFCMQMANGQIMKGVALEDLKVDAPVALSKYVIGSKALRKDPKLRKYAESLIKTHEKILRLTTDRRRTLGISDQLITEAGQISVRRKGVIHTKRTKKLSPNKRKSNAMGTFKYGVYIPRNVEEAKRVDKENGNTLWQDAIIKEISALWSMKTFKLLTKEQRARLKEDYQYAPLRCIFDIKETGRRKARIVIGGHVIDTTGHDTYASTMKTISARLLMLLASANKLEVLTGDISNAYLYSKNTVPVAVRLGPEFEVYDKALAGCRPLASVEQALYGIAVSGNRFSAHLGDTLRSLNFERTRFDPEIWLRRAGSHYEYIGAHTDDLMIVSKNPKAIMDELCKTYRIGKIEEPRFHLGCDYRKEKDGTWSVGTHTYVVEAIKRVKHLLDKEDTANGEDTLGFENIPMREKLKPETDKSDLCDIETHRKYQQLVGIAQWLITCGRMDLSFTISSLSRFSHAPRKGHMKAMIHCFRYLNRHRDKWLRLDPSDHIPPGELTLPTDLVHVDWHHYYPDAKEELDPKFPKPLGKPMTSAVYFDSNWAHDEVT